MAGFNKKYEKWKRYGGGGQWSDYALDAAVYGSQLALSPIAAPVAMATGQSIPDLLGYEAKTKAGQIGSNIYSKGQQVGGNIALGMLGGGNMGAAKAATSQLPKQEEQPVELPKDYQNVYQQQDMMYKFKSGGLNQYRTINIEKGELLVNPRTLEILDSYHDAPKHPEGKNEIDLRGNREVPVGMAIIPAKLANEFKSASPERKKEIINSLPGFNGNPKAANGVDLTFAPPQVPDNAMSTPEEIAMLGGQPSYDNRGKIVDQLNGVQQPLVDENLVNMGLYKSYSPYTSQTSTGGNNAAINLATLGATAPALGFGLYQTIAANKALKKLGKEPYSMYNEQVQPELQSSYGAAQARAGQASTRAQYGLSQAQQAAYNQNVARDINTRMQRAQDIGGGNVSQTIGNIMNANKIQAAQQQAVLDAQLQMQKQQYADRAAQYAEGLAQRIAAARQGQQNQNTAFQQSLRLQKERAYGLAKQKGLENVMNAPMQGASILATYYGGK